MTTAVAVGGLLVGVAAVPARAASRPGAPPLPKTGVRGVVFTAQPTGGSGRGQVRLGISYAGFSQVSGGNYGPGLGLVQLPACALTTPQRPECRAEKPLASVNDPATQDVSAQITAPVPATTAGTGAPAMAATGGAVVLAATPTSSDGGGPAGTYSATSLRASGTWSAGDPIKPRLWKESTMYLKKHLIISLGLAASLAASFFPAYADAAIRPSALGNHVGIAATAGQCAFSKNPYSMPRSVLAACGYHFINRSSIADLPAGGRSYVYYVAGHKVMYNVPPKSFNVLAATNQQLREYNIPSRDLLGGTRNWNRIMRRVQFAAPPTVLIEGPRPFSVKSANWAGYVDTGHSDYNEVAVSYTEPHIGSSVCSSTAEGTWVGIGGYTSSSLGQDGTAYGTGHPHGAWWEVLPAGPVYSSWNGSAGDTIHATTTRDTTTGKWNFAVIDGSHILNPAEQGGSYSGTSAEFITERPLANNLANFGTIPFTNAYAYYGSTGRHGVGQVSHTQIIMWDGSRNMATPSSISGTNSQNFSISQNHCN